MAEISRSRADENPWNLPISSASEPRPGLGLGLGLSPDDGSLYRPSSEREARESTELARLRRNYSRASSYHTPASSRTTSKPTTLLGRLTYAVKKFWKHQVSVTVPHESCRDHLVTVREPSQAKAESRTASRLYSPVALERTFLGYLRTSLVLSMLGVLVSQLYRLQHAPSPDPRFGFYVLGKPLACICHGVALCVIILGGFKSWRTQNAMVRGKALSGGFEIILVGAGVFLVLMSFFVLVLAVDIKKEYF